MTHKIMFDDSCWPMVVVRYPKQIVHEDFLAHLERVVGYVQRDEPWGMLNDSRGAAHPNASQRQAIASFYDAHELLVRKNWRGTAVVFDSPMIAGVLTALTWLRPTPHPFKAFSSYEDGERWLRNRFTPSELAPSAGRRVA
jgi:hypothetical protein